MKIYIQDRIGRCLSTSGDWTSRVSADRRLFTNIIEACNEADKLIKQGNMPTNIKIVVIKE